MAEPHSVLAERPGKDAWFSVAGAPVAWFTQELLGWLVASQGCAQPDRAAILSPAAMRITEIAIAIVALVVALLALRQGVVAWRHAGDARFRALHAGNRPTFLAAAGIIVSAVFVVGIVWAGLSAALLPVCEAVR